MGYLPKKKFAKELYIEISQDMYDFFKAHPEDFQNISDSINEKMIDYDTRAFDWKQKAASRWRDVEKLRAENKKLRELTGQGILSHRINSVYIPKVVLYAPNFKDMSSGACILYSLMLDLRLSSILKGYIDNNNVLFISENDLIQMYNEIGISDFNYYEALEELESNGLAYVDQLDTCDFRSVYVRVFSTEEEDFIMSRVCASTGAKWISDTSVR